MSPGARVRERRFRGARAVEIEAGGLTAVFVPDLGMTGVSLRHRGAEHLALPGGLDALRAGGTGGIPLLAPWANRLSQRRYEVAGVSVDLRRAQLPVDDNGLPIHGFLLGWPGWSVDQLTVRGDAARVRASTVVDAPAFPFPHRIEIAASVRDSRLRVDTTIVPTGRRPVPVAFGWHPYLRLPDEPRAGWRLRLPAREHLALDDRGIPTGVAAPEGAEFDPIAHRTFDDGYALGRDRRLAIENAAGRSIELRCAAGYPFAQVWVPRGKRFVALEPMTAATNSLVVGQVPIVEPGDSFTASFFLTFCPAT